MACKPQATSCYRPDRRAQTAPADGTITTKSSHVDRVWAYFVTDLLTSSYNKITLFILEVKNNFAVWVKPFCQRSVSASCLFKLSLQTTAALLERLYIYTNPAGMKDPVFSHFSSITHRQDDNARSERELLWFWFILFCLCTAAVLLCGPLEVPLLQREHDVLQGTKPGRHRSDECFV